MFSIEQLSIKVEIVRKGIYAGVLSVILVRSKHKHKDLILAAVKIKGETKKVLIKPQLRTSYYIN